LAEEWHPIKNGTLTSKDVKPNSNIKVWWLCKNNGHEWEASINNRNSGHGCPYCSGRFASTENCLAIINPKLAKEWHPTKNGNLTPKDVTPSSGKKVWWLCKDRGHVWEASVNDRNAGRGCPYCAGKRVCEDNCLQTLNPLLAEEWHPTKNGTLTPKDIVPGSNKKVWWLCKYRGHVWEADVEKRNAGTGCPYCAGKRVCEDNCLQTLNPLLAEEWHPTKNGNLTPKDVTPSSGKKVWWLCKKKRHEWKTYIYSRNAGTGCPYCSKRMK
jgi:uncharacterized Zn-finger protein